MILLEDTRNKEGKHENIKKYCDSKNIEIKRVKLEIGDYQFPNGKIVIDTKRNLDEVATNLMNRNDSSRFWREVRRAHEQGIKLVILVESGRTVKNINEVVRWKSKYSTVTGRRLIDEMIRTEMAYSVRWCFCDRRSTAKRIIEILNGGE